MVDVSGKREGEEETTVMGLRGWEERLYSMSESTGVRVVLCVLGVCGGWLLGVVVVCSSEWS